MDSFTMAAEKQRKLDLAWAEICSRCSALEKKMKVTSPIKENVRTQKITTSDGQTVIIRKKVKNDN